MTLIRCRFAARLQDVPRDYLTIVGTREAVKAVTQERIRNLDPTTPGIISTSIDEVRPLQCDHYSAAAEHISKEMDKSYSEEHELRIFQGMVMLLTVNKLNRATTPYYQGQSVFIQEVGEDSSGSQFVIGRLIPHGERIVWADHAEENWPQIRLRKEKLRETFYGTNYGYFFRRTQFPLRHGFASTVHRVIGDTCSKVAAIISALDKTYSLWERGQLTVMISRVTNLDDLMFVGPLEETLEAIIKLLKTDKCKEIAQIDERLKNLNLLAQRNRISVPGDRDTNMKPLCRSLPPDANGYVYLVVSALYPEVYEIFTEWNIRRHLLELNSGASLDIKNGSRPYLPGFFITGFGGANHSIENFNERHLFEQEFLRNQMICQASLATGYTYQHAIAVGHLTFQQMAEPNNLVFVECLEISNSIRETIQEFVLPEGENF